MDTISKYALAATFFSSIYNAYSHSMVLTPPRFILRVLPVVLRHDTAFQWDENANSTDIFGLKNTVW